MRVMDQNGLRSNQNLERLHGSPFNATASSVPHGCIVPSSHAVSNTMAKLKLKNKKKAVKPRQKSKPQASKQMKRVTPYTDMGQAIGRHLGGFLPYDIGGHVGKFLGAGVGSIFGSGDYVLNGQQASYNVLSGSVPQFSSDKATNIVCHREYLQDFSGTSSFNINQFALNPGLTTTFPWLSTIAQCYQQYRFHGIVFEFRPLTTDFANSGVPGVVVMATNYNADAPVYLTKQEMENSEFAESVKPTTKMLHMIECKPSVTVDPIKYIRTGNVPTGQDLRLYDQGLFQFATQNNSAGVVLGELWVTYCVEFLKPIMSTDVTGGVLSGHFRRILALSASPLGQAAVSNTPYVGNLNANCSTTNLQWFAEPGTVWQVTILYNGGAVAITAPGAPTFSGCQVSTIWNANTGGSISVPSFGATSSSLELTYVVSTTITTPGFIALTFGAGATFPSTNAVDIVITNQDITLLSL